MARRNIETHLRYNDEEYEKVRERARSLDMTIAKYIRYISVHGEIKKYDMQIVQDVRMEMRKIGMNVNQIVHMVNFSQYANDSDIEKMQIQIRALSDVLEKWLRPLDVSWGDDSDK